MWCIATDAGDACDTGGSSDPTVPNIASAAIAAWAVKIALWVSCDVSVGAGWRPRTSKGGHPCCARDCGWPPAAAAAAAVGATSVARAAIAGHAMESASRCCAAGAAAVPWSRPPRGAWAAVVGTHRPRTPSHRLPCGVRPRGRTIKPVFCAVGRRDFGLDTISRPEAVLLIEESLGLLADGPGRLGERRVGSEPSVAQAASSRSLSVEVVNMTPTRPPSWLPRWPPSCRPKYDGSRWTILGAKALLLGRAWEFGLTCCIANAIGIICLQPKPHGQTQGIPDVSRAPEPIDSPETGQRQALMDGGGGQEGWITTHVLWRAWTWNIFWLGMGVSHCWPLYGWMSGYIGIP